MHSSHHSILCIALSLFSLLSFLTTEASIKLRPYLNKAVSQTDSIAWTPTQPQKNLSIAQDSLMIKYITVDSMAKLPLLRYKQTLPAGKFAPPVYDSYQFTDDITLFDNDSGSKTKFAKAYQWIDDYDLSNRLLLNAIQSYEINNPRNVRFNAANLPEVPKKYRNYVDKLTTRIVLDDIKVEDKELQNVENNIGRKIWLHTFDGSLQFSQAYISPNWYQGGNNNLNMIGQLLYNVKLNQKFYPKLLFDATVSYKLAMNSAPDDSIHSVNISEDIFQVNATFGLKAARSWYYSANLMFKTQLFNSYPTNSRNLQAAFLSPGELNVGLGMTYNKTNKKKTATFGASISPLSWNLKTCTNRNIDETTYGLVEGRHTKNKVGSSAECTLEWKLAYNITYHSRLFLFTDYEYAYGDWEHTVDFNINRFLSTRLYLHMRYDTSTPTVADDTWRKFQLKEIFSFGFAYHFGTI